MDSGSIKPKSTFQLTLNYRMVIVVLLVVIAGMLAIWRPWQTQAGANDRSISVNGEAIIKAAPDEFIFYPSYEFINDDKKAGLAELTKKSDEIVAKLKELGVPDNKIKIDSSAYNHSWYYDDNDQKNHYTLSLTITLDNLEKAQKVQNYLVTTEPQGSVSPQASFSNAKRKELENQARDEATKDARAKADQSAKNLGFNIGKVKSVSDGSGFGEIMPMYKGGDMMGAEGMDSSMQLAVQPGENELSYSVTVEYYIR